MCARTRALPLPPAAAGGDRGAPVPTVYTLVPRPGVGRRPHPPAHRRNQNQSSGTRPSTHPTLTPMTEPATRATEEVGGRSDGRAGGRFAARHPAPPARTPHARPPRVRGRQPHRRPPPRLAGRGLDLVGHAEAGDVGHQVAQPRRGERREPEAGAKQGFDLFACHQHDKIVDKAEADERDADGERDAAERGAVDRRRGRRLGRPSRRIVQPQRPPKLGGVQGAGRVGGVGRGEECVGVPRRGRPASRRGSIASVRRRRIGIRGRQHGQQLPARGGRQPRGDRGRRAGRRGQRGPQRVSDGGRGCGARHGRRRAARGGREHRTAVRRPAPMQTATPPPSPPAMTPPRPLLLAVVTLAVVTAAAAAPTAADVSVIGRWARAGAGAASAVRRPRCHPPRCGPAKIGSMAGGSGGAAPRTPTPTPPDRPPPSSPAAPPRRAGRAPRGVPRRRHRHVVRRLCAVRGGQRAAVRAVLLLHGRTPAQQARARPPPHAQAVGRARQSHAGVGRGRAWRRVPGGARV